jgi:hypothetical protein
LKILNVARNISAAFNFIPWIQYNGILVARWKNKTSA